MMFWKKSKFFIATLIIMFANNKLYANQDIISLFLLEHYDQTIATWINTKDSYFDKPLLSEAMQRERLKIFINHYVGSFSPWNANHITKLLKQVPPNDLKTIEKELISNFDNEGKAENEIGYAENFRPYPKTWIEKIIQNINLSQFGQLTYQKENRGIAINNLAVRALPTDNVFFYSYKLAGQGYPFDNLQISALWVGTPVYILGETENHDWILIVTPDYIGWVKSQGIAKVNDAFVSQWTNAANSHLAAITHTETTIVDNKGNFLFSAYVGTVFPAFFSDQGIKLMIPVANLNHEAVIKKVAVATDKATMMPFTITPHHISMLMATMIGRPYGWGNLYFYNDCSSELKSFFTPFGLWLPRHSSDQVTAGRIMDMTKATEEERLSYLMKNGQKFLTLIYLGGHVVLYIGNYPNPNKKAELMAMTYQNLWGLSPNPPERRAVIGQSVLLPMLLQYPEDTTLQSLTGKKHFEIAYLNELPSGLLINEEIIDIKALMYPELLLEAPFFSLRKF